MAPTRIAAKIAHGAENAPVCTGMSTRSKNGMATFKSTLKQAVKGAGKRKAGSPLREAAAKRAAFGDITNAVANGAVDDKNQIKKVVVAEKKLPAVKVVKKKQVGEKAAIKIQNAVKTQPTLLRDSHWYLKKKSPVKIKEQPKPIANESKKFTRRSNGYDLRLSEQFSEESLYVSATEDVSGDGKSLIIPGSIKTEKEPSLSRDINLLAISEKEASAVPEGVVDFDKENWNDPFQVSNYAMDIFNYLKSREPDFPIEDYLPKQKTLTAWMRALLVDWMVEVQESFELNHETLYLAVKLVDLYLCKEVTKKDELQLLGAASLLIASKFDERIPPLIDDFLYICDGAYRLDQLLKMEINILRVIGFDIGIPLSYRFLRRYARCARVSMPALTLARYILELCLMEYALIPLSDSKMAAAALYLAIRMKKLGTWTPTHEYYTGYTLEEILPIVRMQNVCLHKKPKEALSTVRNKYSHRIFFEVAKVPIISDDELT